MIASISSAATRAVHVTCGQRDLHLGWKQTGAVQARQRLFLERSLDRAGRRVDLALRQPHQREAGLGVASEVARARESLLGRLELAHAEPDLADLVERLARDSRVEVLQLLRGLLEFAVGIRPGAAQPHDLGAVDSAHAREPRDRLSLAPARRRLRPLCRAAVIGQVAAGIDRVAVDDRRRKGVEFPGHRRGADLIDQRQAGVDVALVNSHDPLAESRLSEEVPVLESSGDVESPLDVLERLVEVALAVRDQSALELQIPVHRRFRLAFEQPGRALVPTGRHRELELVPVLDCEVKGSHRRPLVVPLFGVPCVGALGSLDGVCQAAGPHRRLGEDLQVLGAEPSACVRGLQELESLLPRTALGRIAARFARILDDLAHRGAPI